MSKSKTDTISHATRLISELITRAGGYRVTDAIGWLCSGHDRFPDAISLRSGIVYAEPGMCLFALGERPRIEYVDSPTAQEVIAAVRLATWYASLMRHRPDERIELMLNKMAGAGIGLTAPEGRVVQITRANLGILCRLPRETVCRFLAHTTTFPAYPGLSLGILVKHGAPTNENPSESLSDMASRLRPAGVFAA